MPENNLKMTNTWLENALRMVGTCGKGFELESEIVREKYQRMNG